MARILKWSAAILGVLLLAVLAVVVVLAVFRFGGIFGGMPMMARGFRGPLVMGGGLRFFALPLMLFRLLIPLALVALLVLLGYLAGRGAGRAPVQVQAQA